MAYNNAGSAMIRAGRYLMAQKYLEDGLRIAEDDHTRARLLDNLAIVHYHLANLSVADPLSREASTLAASDEVLRPITNATRSTILFGLKRYKDAEPVMREVIENSRKMGDEPAEIRWLYNLGYCLVEVEKTDEGLDHLRTAAARAAERGDPDLRAKSLYFFGRCLYAVGRHEDAASPLKSSLLIARDNDFRNEAFHSAYYLWQIASERGAKAEEADYLAIARRYRERLEQRSEEAEAFDVWLAKAAKRSSLQASDRASTGLDER